jgi:hypothetical protein
LFWKSFNEREQKSYEGTLAYACERAASDSDSMVSDITVEELLDIIITAERFGLKDLLSASLKLISKCDFRIIIKCRNYDKISSSTKEKMYIEKLETYESRYSKCYNSSPSTKVRNAYSSRK